MSLRKPEEKHQSKIKKGEEPVNMINVHLDIRPHITLHTELLLVVSACIYDALYGFLQYLQE